MVGDHQQNKQSDTMSRQKQVLHDSPNQFSKSNKKNPCDARISELEGSSLLDKEVDGLLNWA